MPTVYLRREVEARKKAQKSEPLSEVARILPPLLGNLRAFRRVAGLSAENQAEFQKIEDWLIEYSKKMIRTGDK